MATIVILLLLLIVGIVLGLAFPFGARGLRVLGRAVSVMVYLLLLVLGLQLGLNDAVLDQLGEVGVSALVVTASAVVFSVAACLFAGRWLKFGSAMEEGSLGVGLGGGTSGRGGSGRAVLSSLSFLVVFLFGVLFGVYGKVPSILSNSSLSEWVLYPFMVLVGLGIGGDRATLRSVRGLRVSNLLLPLFTVLGTFVGGALAFLLLPGLSFWEVEAVASGYGYYSLSSIIISAEHSEVVGAVALLSNILRELTAIFFAPLFVRLGGGAAAVSVAGATSMDTTLPFIVSAAGSEYAIVALYHGVVLTVLVPFAVGVCLLML